VFDVPVPEYTAEDRILIYSNLTVGRKYISLVPQTLCTGRANLDEFFKDVTSAGGEGVMLRAPGSLYENKRSKNLLKYKPVDDDEATVMGYKPGAGKYEGMTGTLVCVWHDVLIDIGTGLTDEDRKNPPPIGTVITFTYHGLTDGGAPRFPSYKGVRE
jgi:DNA ligase-1